MAHSHGHSHAAGSHGHSHEHAPDADDMEADGELETDALESAHQATVVATFDRYLQQALSANQRRRADYYSLSEGHRALLPGFNDLLKEVDAKLQINAKLVHAMVEANVFPPAPDAALSAAAPKEGDHERLRSTLRQCVRDWSAVGKRERDETYGPVLQALERSFGGLSAVERGSKKILVPGAGLGRLAWEIVNAGFSCQANEFSLFMLIASAFILNQTTKNEQFELYPYMHTFSNTRSRADLLAPIYIPDVLPSDISASRGDFSFAAGSFEEVYGKENEAWDAVVTCFFIDTARNIVEYLERIFKLLKPGGLWINIGPTLWHFENTEGARSIELTLEDVKALATRIGFVFVEEKEVHTSYTSNPRSLLRHEYTAAFWIATKGAVS